MATHQAGRTEDSDWQLAHIPGVFWKDTGKTAVFFGLTFYASLGDSRCRFHRGHNAQSAYGVKAFSGDRGRFPHM